MKPPQLIKIAIGEHLSNKYGISYSILDFAYYGSNSHRKRTLVIGVRKDVNVNPKTLFPNNKVAPTLRELIGDLPVLNTMGEISETDIYHNFREYDNRMFDWIHNTPEGGSAFDNENPYHRPHQLDENGEIIFNQRKMVSKYSRCWWDKIAPCILTRNDTISSTSTIHPQQDRVFSIRECMLMQTIPYGFRWSDKSLNELNKLSLVDKQLFLKENELNIRQCIGESVPTEIFRQIADKIKLAEINPIQLKHIPNCNFGKIDNQKTKKLF